MAKTLNSTRKPAADVVRAALADDALRLLAREPGARGGDSKHVHRMRTATRRMRSDLRLFRPLLEGDRAAALRGELHWLAGLLGAVRDLDVMAERLQGAVVSLGIVAEADPIFEGIAGRRASAVGALIETLDGERYGAIRFEMIDQARAPEFGTRAERPVSEVLVEPLDRAWSRLRRAVGKVAADAPFEDLHGLRKRSKQTRYAAESVAEALGDRSGRRAHRIAERSRRLQETLGLLQDAVVSADRLREIAGGMADDAPARSAIDALIAFEVERAEAGRSAYEVGRRRFDRR